MERFCLFVFVRKVKTVTSRERRNAPLSLRNVVFVLRRFRSNSPSRLSIAIEADYLDLKSTKKSSCGIKEDPIVS